jgi:hypothetical protein
MTAASHCGTIDGGETKRSLHNRQPSASTTHLNIRPWLTHERRKQRQNIRSHHSAFRQAQHCDITGMVNEATPRCNIPRSLARVRLSLASQTELIAKLSSISVVVNLCLSTADKSACQLVPHQG